MFSTNEMFVEAEARSRRERLEAISKNRRSKYRLPRRARSQLPEQRHRAA